MNSKKNLPFPFWLSEDGYLMVIDQTKLPFQLEEVKLKTADEVYYAIKTMLIRGAGVIGNVAAFGIYLSSLESGGDINQILTAAKKISSARPTAVNLNWAVDRMLSVLERKFTDTTERLRQEAIAIANEDKINSELIGRFGFEIIKSMIKRKNKNKINILTHCNAGSLAIYNNGSALAPIYEAIRNEIDLHVWVDETRPRNQGSNLTAWELKQAGIDFTIIPDNTGGLLMQRGEVDLVFVGADRVTKNGDVVNKIGTYLKALAAKDNRIPFYVLFPSSTLDLSLNSGNEVPIEERDGEEVRFINGMDSLGNTVTTQIIRSDMKVANYAFDITPARLITRFITEKGISRTNKWKES